MAASLARSMVLNVFVQEEESVGAQRSDLLLNEEEHIALYIAIPSTAMFMLHIQPFKISPPVLHSRICEPTSKNTVAQTHVRSAVASSKVQRSVCSNASYGFVVSRSFFELPCVAGTYVDEPTVALGEELVGSGNVHTLVVGVEKPKFELDRVLAVDVGGVSDREALVVAGGGLEAGRVGIPSHHLLGGLFGEGLASRIEVLDVTNEFGSGADGLGDDSADSRGTSRDENSSEDWFALAEAVLSGIESASAHGDGGAVDNSRAAGKSGDDGGERRHVECWKVTDLR